MAAADWSRSRGAAGVRATTGMFSIFTLLCLVCLSSSLTYKEQLKVIKENNLKGQMKLDELKAIYKPKLGTAKHFSRLAVSLVESMETFMKADGEEFPDDSAHLQGVMQDMRDLAERNKNMVEIKDEEMQAQIENTEKDLEYVRKIIACFEEQLGEL